MRHSRKPPQFLVICYKNKKLDKRKKLHKTIAKNGTVVETKKLYDDKLPAWIEQRVREQQRTIDFKAAAVLAESVGADLGTLYNQINKLCLIVAAGEAISADHVEQHVGISKEYNNFELRKSPWEWSYGQSLYHCTLLWASSTATSVIGGPSGVYTTILCNCSPTTVCLPKTLMRLPKPWAYIRFFVREIEQAARRYPLKSIVPILGSIRKADLAVKGVDAVPTSEGEVLQELLSHIA